MKYVIDKDTVQRICNRINDYILRKEPVLKPNDGKKNRRILLGRYYADKAFYGALLDKNIDYEKCFEIATKYHLEALDIDFRIHDILYRELLQYVILSESQSLFEKIKDFSSYIDYDKISTEYNDMLLSFLSKKSEKETIEKLSKVLDRPKTTNDYFPMYLDKLGEAILEKDSNKFVEYLEKVLGDHNRLRPKRALGAEASYWIICIPAVALLKIATQRGLEINLDDFDEFLKQFIPEVLWK